MRIQILSQKEGATILLADIFCSDAGSERLMTMVTYDDEIVGKKRGEQQWKIQK